MSVNKGKEGGFFLKHFIAIPAGKMDGMIQRLPQRRELSAKLTEGVVVVLPFEPRLRWIQYLCTLTLAVIC